MDTELWVAFALGYGVGFGAAMVGAVLYFRSLCK